MTDENINNLNLAYTEVSKGFTGKDLNRVTKYYNKVLKSINDLRYTPHSNKILHTVEQYVNFLASMGKSNKSAFLFNIREEIFTNVHKVCIHKKLEPERYIEKLNDLIGSFSNQELIDNRHRLQEIETAELIVNEFTETFEERE